MTAYEFILKMKNYASSELQKVSQELGVVKSKEMEVANGMTNIGDKAKTTGGAVSSLKGIFGGLVGVLGAVGIGIGFYQVVNMMEQGVEKAHALHAAEAQIKAGLESTRGVAGLVFDDLEKSAGKFSKSVLYGRADIMAMQSILLTFPAVTKNSFDPASEVILDMSTRLGQDLKSSAIQVGKALQDPIKGVTALRRVGVNFNSTQIETIKHLVETGQKAKAQGLIMKELNTEFGGSAKAAFNADPLAKYNKVVGSMKIQLGEAAIKVQAALAPALIFTAKLFGTLIIQVPKFTSKLIEIAKWIIGNKPLMIGLGLILAGIGLNFLIAEAGSIAFSFGMGILNIATTIATGAMAAFNFVMAMNPISLVIIAIGLLIAIVAILWNKFGWLRGTVLGVWEVLKGLGTMIKNYVVNRFAELITGIGSAGKAIWAFVKGDWSGAMAEAKKAGTNLMGVNSKEQALKDGKAAIGSFNKGWTAGMKEVATPKKKPVKEAQKAFSPLMPGLDLGGDGDGGGDKKDKKDKKKSDGIISGGSKQTTINITIGKLNEKIEIYTTNLKEGAGEIEQKVNEILLRAVNSVNQMQTN
jgi:phage-related minor tail protein